jgi:hypothetical protein
LPQRAILMPNGWVVETIAAEAFERSLVSFDPEVN